MSREPDPLTREIYRRIRELTPEQLAVLRQWISDNPELAETVEEATTCHGFLRFPCELPFGHTGPHHNAFDGEWGGESRRT